MRNVLASLVCSAVLLAAPAAAQETVQVGDIEATRVVIAPPQSELAAIIKSGLAAAYDSATRDTRAYSDAQKLYYFYGARHFEPLWLSQGANGRPVLSENARELIEVFKAAGEEGFRPADYLTPDIDLAAAGTDPARLAAFETAFSAAALRYAQDAVGGRIKPSSVSSLWTIKPRQVDEAAMLVQLATAEDPAAVLKDLHPEHREFLLLREALAKFNDGMTEEQTRIPEGALLKPGMTDERLPLLRQRLGVAVPEGGETLAYDEAVVEAVKGFQESLGLTVDGVIGPATVAALNGGAATTREDIIANMERWRWMPEDLGDFHVFVNIPEFRLFVEKGTVARGYDVAYTTRVVVGTPRNQTPVFTDEIEHVVVNPYWNVPPSIARNEIGPRLAANPSYLASQNMELLYDGQLINAAAVDWSVTSVSNFRIRQRPGAGNALGQIKFLFPNQHDVYLHDTPSKALFQRSFRAYSHGCVRVQNPMEFAAALLEHEPELSVASLESMFGSKERWNNLDTHVPVQIAYFTLRVDADGTIRSYGDVYGHNKRLIELLAE